MNRLLTVFLAVCAVFILAWTGLVLVPYFQLGNLYPIQDEITGSLVPPSLSGAAEKGRQVYAANGCVYCHSQQVRSEAMGSDIKRGWGKRRTVARDYLMEQPIFLGNLRIGPDLSNVGQRQTSAAEYHLHLYDPAKVAPGSTMPPYRFLYKKQRIAGEPSQDALKLETVENGYEVVPTREAKALVAYLQSLDKTYPLPEAPSS